MLRLIVIDQLILVKGNYLRREFVIHKVWMMRSYGFCLVFVMSRVPDALPGFHWTDAFLAHTL